MPETMTNATALIHRHNSAPSQFARLRFEAGRLKSNDPTFRSIPSSGPAVFTTGPASIMYMVLTAAKFWKCVCCDSHRRNDDDDVQPGSEIVGCSSFANI